MGKKPRTHTKRHFMTILKYFLVGLVMIIAYNSLTIACDSSSQSNQREVSRSENVLADKPLEDLSACPEVECPEIEPEVVEVEKIIEKDKIVEKKIYVCQNLRQVSNPDDCLVTDSEGWYEVKTFTGSGPRKTEPFKINGDRWRYTFICNNVKLGGGYNIALYDLEEDPELWIDAFLMASCDDNPKPSYVYSGNSEYFFDVFIANMDSYNLVIEAKK